MASICYKVEGDIKKPKNEFSVEFEKEIQIKDKSGYNQKKKLDDKIDDIKTHANYKNINKVLTNELYPILCRYYNKDELIEYAALGETLTDDVEIASRAYYKLWEVLKDRNSNFKELFKHVVFLAEGPGGFIDCVRDMSQVFNKTSLKSWKAITLESTDETLLFKEKFKSHINYGDLTKFKDIDKFQKTINQKATLVTADGGIEVGKKFVLKEEFHIPLFFGECVTAMACSAKGADFVLKIYDIFLQPTIAIIQMLNYFYKTVWICKPITSRICNSEKYIYAKGFKGKLDASILEQFYKILEKMKDNKEYIKLFPQWTITSTAGDIKKYNKLFFKGQNDINQTIFKSIKTLDAESFLVDTIFKKGFIGAYEKKKEFYKLNPNLFEEQSYLAINFLNRYSIPIDLDYQRLDENFIEYKDVIIEYTKLTEQNLDTEILSFLFIGGNPISLDSQNYQDLINMEYRMGIKIDGERNFIFVNRVGKCYTIDRNMQINIIKGIKNPSMKNTIIDAETVVHSTKVYYFMFDLLFIQGFNIQHHPYSKRHEDLEVYVKLPRENFFIKPFYTLNNITKENFYIDFKRNVNKQFSFLTFDGLIFAPWTTPYVQRRWDRQGNRQFKWKEVHTIDFTVIADPEIRKYILCALKWGAHHDLCPIDQVPFTQWKGGPRYILEPETIGKFNKTSKNKIKNRSVVEFIPRKRYRKIEFEPYRVRIDKSLPNVVKVAKSNLDAEVKI